MASPIDFIAGCVGGAAGVLVGHPLDTVKVVMQTSAKRLSMTSVLADHSIFSLYRGLSAPLAGLTAINAIVFGVYGSVMKRMGEPSLLCQAMAGCAAGLSQSMISCPMELIKTRAQLRSSTVLSCLKNTIHTEGGVRALYRGYWATVARDAPAFAVYFSSYELLLKFSKNSTPSTLLLLFAGGTAGAASWLAIYPLDVIKSRIQADTTTYNSIRHCIKHSISEEGVGVFMRGVAPTLVRAFPSNATTFAVVTWTLWSYENYYSGVTQRESEDILE